MTTDQWYWLSDFVLIGLDFFTLGHSGFTKAFFWDGLFDVWIIVCLLCAYNHDDIDELPSRLTISLGVGFALLMTLVGYLLR